MGRANSNKRRGKGATNSATAPAGDAREGNGITRTDGKNDPDKVTHLPADIADPQARVITNK